MKILNNFKKIFLLVVFFGILVLIFSFSDFFKTKEAQAGWYSTGGTWGYRKAITIDHNKVAGTSDLTNFPVLIDITDSGLQANAQADGDDILFTSADGTTKLDYEREIYTTATGRLTAWVEVPTLDFDDNTIIYMYYGNADATDQQNVSGTWDTNYKGVWHLSDGTTLGAVDSIGNGNGTLQGTPTAGLGKIDGAMLMDANTDYINAGSSNEFNFTSESFTMGAWIKPPSSGQAAWQTFIARGTYTVNGWYIQNDDSVNRNGVVFVTNQSAGTHQLTRANGKLSLDVWNYVVITRNGASVRIYVNGTDQTTSAGSHNNPTSVSTNLIIGKWLNGMDEVRISNTVRSADWIATEYNNQSATSTFYSIEDSPLANPTGSVKSPVSTLWYNASWGYAKKITIDHTKVSGSVNLNDFPVLISMTEADLRTVANGGYVGTAGGTDILFVGENGQKLDHEIEKYTPTTGELIAWVRVPALYPVNNTNIIMYFGNADASDQQNVTGVWASNYKWVTHLGDGTTLDLNDSTANNYDATLQSTPTATAGKINGGVRNYSSGSKYIYYNSSWADFSGNFTYSGWVNLIDSSTGNGDFVFGQTYGSTDINVIYINSSDQKIRSQIRKDNGTPSTSGALGPALSTANWYYIVYQMDTSDNYTVYVNGVSYGGTHTAEQRMSEGLGGTAVRLGAPSTWWNINDADFDEVRFSNIIHSSDWIATEYANQNATSTFYTIGTTLTSSTVGEVLTPTTSKIKVRGGVKFR